MKKLAWIVVLVGIIGLIAGMGGYVARYRLLRHWFEGSPSVRLSNVQVTRYGEKPFLFNDTNVLQALNFAIRRKTFISSGLGESVHAKLKLNGVWSDQLVLCWDEQRFVVGIPSTMDPLGAEFEWSEVPVGAEILQTIQKVVRAESNASK